MREGKGTQMGQPKIRKIATPGEIPPAYRLDDARRPFMYGKLHRVTVTEARVDYVGSITIDPLMLRAAGILPYSRVDVVNVANGNRLQTYVIEGREGAGDCCLNGAAAHLFAPGDLAIIMAYEDVPAENLPGRESVAVMVDGGNRVTEIWTYATPAPDEVGESCRHGEVFARSA
ncbi:Aspartate 1-decarboxylase [uncultured Alphaproteobacteria bacterium]|uniref:Aspartate 1-decarboxylase n=1 Tax=uncultured Alphaproteobacteria bacterium TaxID=91750 RepID=A0A212KLL9_9PROT|nr:Aspartate 1-decarboxylase [uncultured Alphaproteobacteria bacterium]